MGWRKGKSFGTEKTGDESYHFPVPGQLLRLFLSYTQSLAFFIIFTLVKSLKGGKNEKRLCFYVPIFGIVGDFLIIKCRPGIRVC